MAGQENLKFIKSTEEAREKGRAGGIASGKARRRKRAMREAADLFLSLPVTDRRKLKKLKAKELDEEDIDQQMAMIAGLVVRLVGNLEEEQDAGKKTADAVQPLEKRE